jgi:hypothetical protein
MLVFPAPPDVLLSLKDPKAMWLDHQQDIARKVHAAGFRGDVTLHVPRTVAKELVAWASAHDVTIQNAIDVRKIRTITETLTVQYRLDESLTERVVAIGSDGTRMQFPATELLAYERF